MEAGAERILADWRIPPGQCLLDIGCGAGQTAIPAARLGYRVTGVDIAENLIETAAGRAQAENLDARFDVGDAEALPYPDASFDVVITLIGAMFAPRPERVVSEIARVLRPGGRLCMANWTPGGMPAQMFKCVAGVVPPPPDRVPPVLWGDEETVVRRLTPQFSDLRLTRKRYPAWRYPFDVQGMVDLFRASFGPVKRAFERLDGDRSAVARFEGQLRDIYRANSVALPGGGTLVTGGEYLDIVATRRPEA
jgi:SAM-dependent methyltransferase